jgi:2-keto-3-deoxy-L-rhamnonate aldolase RhmA
MPVRINPLKASLAKGQIQVGTWIMLVRNPAVLPFMKSIGLDYAKADMEHTPISLEMVGDMATVARTLDFSLVVRPPQGNREWITRLLDAGVWNLYIPQVNTPETAYEIANIARHAPAGNRGTFEPGPQNDYALPDEPSARLTFLNEQVHITVMLESIESFRHLDEIVGMPGIDAVGIGPADLAQELGVYDRPDEARVVEEYKQRLREAAVKHRKTLEMGVWSVEEGEKWIRQGAQILTYKTDTTALRDVFLSATARLRQTA